MGRYGVRIIRASNGRRHRRDGTRMGRIVDGPVRAALAVAVLPEEAEGALVLAAEHGFIANEQGEDVAGVGQPPDGLGLALACREAPGVDFGSDDVVDEVGLDAADAAQAPLGVGHFHDEVGFGGALGVELGEVGVAEGDEVVGGL